MASEDWEITQRKAISRHLEAYMSSEVFRGYPMYFPLLDADSLAKMGKDDYENCLPGIIVYLREDVKNSAIFVVSRIPLQFLFPTEKAEGH
jgi:hypothetical protein